MQTNYSNFRHRSLARHHVRNPRGMHHSTSNSLIGMIIMFKQYLYLGALLIVIAALPSCRHPVAYVQRTPVNLPTTRDTQPVPVPPLNQVIISPMGQAIKANTTTPQLEFVARNNNKLAPTKTLSKRMDRVKTWMASTHETVTSQGNYTNGRVNLVQKGMVQKTSETKRGELVPGTIKKAKANWIKLIGGVVLLVVGVAIMLAGPGSIFFLGLVVALFGFVGIILGLFAE